MSTSRLIAYVLFFYVSLIINAIAMGWNIGAALEKQDNTYLAYAVVFAIFWAISSAAYLKASSMLRQKEHEDET